MANLPLEQQLRVGTTASHADVLEKAPKTLAEQPTETGDDF
jgi:hypothetical protein